MSIEIACKLLTPWKTTAYVGYCSTPSIALYFSHWNVILPEGSNKSMPMTKVWKILKIWSIFSHRMIACSFPFSKMYFMMSWYYFPNKTIKYYVISSFVPMLAEKIFVCPSLLRNAFCPNDMSSHPTNTAIQHVTACSGPLKTLRVTIVWVPNFLCYGNRESDQKARVNCWQKPELRRSRGPFPLYFFHVVWLASQNYIFQHLSCPWKPCHSFLSPSHRWGIIGSNG